MSDADKHCHGAINPINLRPLVIFQDCERRHAPGNDSLMGPPAKHDGTKWVCDMRIVNAQRTA